MVLHGSQSSVLKILGANTSAESLSKEKLLFLRMDLRYRRMNDISYSVSLYITRDIYVITDP